MSGFAISEDVFHRKIPYLNKQKYYLPDPTWYDLQEMGFSSEDEYYDILDEEDYLEYAKPNDKKREYTRYSIINQGNAKINNIGERILTVSLPIIEKYGDEIFLNEEVIMLTPRGEIHAGCDWSYETYNSNSENTLLGNVFDDFETIINNIKERDDKK